jgi:hypothetical protein
MAAARVRAPCRLLSYRREILEHLLGEFSADLQQCQAGKRVPQQGLKGLTAVLPSAYTATTICLLHSLPSLPVGRSPRART